MSIIQLNKILSKDPIEYYILVIKKQIEVNNKKKIVHKLYFYKYFHQK